MSGTFPFAAVVGHDDAKLALLLDAVDRRIGGVLLRGDKGSAKSTLARGLAELLGPDTPFVELPVSASEERVVGSLDLEAALTGRGHRFSPGLLAAADGGVLYVDEVNLLPDHLVDVLLDAAASGVNRVERDGVSEVHPARFVLVGSMNPEEGDLRPQLLDRFGLAVDVRASRDPGERAEAVRRRLAFDADPDGFREAWAGATAALAASLRGARPATLPDRIVLTASDLCASVGAEGLRADLVICRAAAALAGWEERAEAGVEDVRRVAALALAHRRRRGPLDDGGVEQEEIDRQLEGSSPPPADRDGDPSGDDPSGNESGDPTVDESGDPSGGDPSGGDGAGGDGAGDGGAGSGPAGGDGDGPLAAPVQAPAEPPAVVALRAPRPPGPNPAAAAGRRSPAEGRRGRLIGDRRPAGPVTDVAPGATIRAAAARSLPVQVERGDLREAVREQRTGNLVVLAVDASASMGADTRMAAVKGAVLGLLVDAYQRRDRVALVTFAGESATVALRPTGSVEVARARLAELPTGGRTPLAAGIDTALGLALRAPATHTPLLVLVSDGRATWADAGDPVEASLTAAGRVSRHGVPAVVVDTEDGHTRLGLARPLAAAMGALHLPLPELTAGGLVGSIRSVASG